MGKDKGDKDRDSMPTDPFSPVFGVAIELFTTYTNFVEAGFTQEQAMQLVAAALATHMQINAVMEAQARRDGNPGA